MGGRVRRRFGDLLVDFSPGHTLLEGPSGGSSSRFEGPFERPARGPGGVFVLSPDGQALAVQTGLRTVTAWPALDDEAVSLTTAFELDGVACHEGLGRTLRIAG